MSRNMSPRPSIRSLADIEAIEREMPWQARVRHNSAYEMIADVARRTPEKAAIVFLPNGAVDDVPITIRYAELKRQLTRTANLLHNLRLAPDQAVSILLPNLPQMHYLLWAGSVAGISNPINPLLRPAQIAQILEAAGTRVLVTTGPGTELWDKALAAVSLVHEPIKLMRIGGTDTPEAENFDEALSRCPDDRLLSERKVVRSDIAAYFHTGGTTGDPKLAQHTQEGQVFQAWAALALGVEEDDVVMVGLPMFHVAAAYCWGLGVLACGATQVLLSPAGFRTPGVVGNLWQLIARYGATRVGIVPTIASALLEVPKAGCDISSVRRYGCGAAPLSTEVARAFSAYVGSPLLEGYGLTEANGITHCNPYEGEQRIGSIGLRAPYVESKVFRADRPGETIECKPGEEGIVAIRGPTVMPGYRQERHNAGAFLREGWLNTGDLGYVDEDGYFWLTGRAKDLIIRGGHNISPAWIEEALYQHPAIALAAAIGKPDAYAGEVPVAYVTLKPGMSAEAEELRAFALERVPERPAAPSEVISPRTDAGDRSGQDLQAELAARCDPARDRDCACAFVGRGDNDRSRGGAARASRHAHAGHCATGAVHDRRAGARTHRCTAGAFYRLSRGASFVGEPRSSREHACATSGCPRLLPQDKLGAPCLVPLIARASPARFSWDRSRSRLVRCRAIVQRRSTPPLQRSASKHGRSTRPRSRNTC
jgi:fatty-acyl-CoA synthase